VKCGCSLSCGFAVLLSAAAALVSPPRQRYGHTGRTSLGAGGSAGGCTGLGRGRHVSAAQQRFRSSSAASASAVTEPRCLLLPLLLLLSASVLSAMLPACSRAPAVGRVSLRPARGARPPAHRAAPRNAGCVPRRRPGALRAPLQRLRNATHGATPFRRRCLPAPCRAPAPRRRRPPLRTRNSNQRCVACVAHAAPMRSHSLRSQTQLNDVARCHARSRAPD
jgi:hypothetical protein